MKGCVVAVMLVCSACAWGATTRPNIIVIVADDMGFSDVGCYGGEIETPNIDRLAQEGLRFTQFYNMARCCPTRASLITGLYPHQAGVGAMCQDLGKPAYRGELSERCVTMAEALRAAGYRTGMVGKWHLSNLTIGGGNRDSKKLINFEIPGEISPSKKSWPVNRGFEEHWGTIAGVGNFYDPWSLVHNEEQIQPPGGKGFYYTDFINDQATRMVEEYSKADAPFFLYVAHTAPHWPMQAREKDIEKYLERYRVGWDEIRQRRYARMVEMGIVKSSWALSPRATEAHRVKVTSWEDAPDKEWEARRMAVYAAMIDVMDQGIGRLLEKLREKKIDDNTIVIFLSDNGGCAENVQRSWYDIPTRTRDGRAIVVGNDPTVMPGDETTFSSYGPAWANASNTPFRGFKHYMEEGGIATPIIVWGAGVKRSGQMERAAVGHVIDVMPTVLESAGVKSMEGLKGVSLWPAIRGEAMGERTLFWEHEGARAVRVGKWKLVAGHEEPWQLFDVEADRTELRDRASVEKERAKELEAKYEAWAKRVGVEEWPVRKPATAVK